MLVWELSIGQEITLKDGASGAILGLIMLKEIRQKAAETTISIGIQAPQTTKIITPNNVRPRNESENGKSPPT